MKIGRPVLDQSEKKAQITGVRLRVGERALLEKAAKTKGQKLSAWMRSALVKTANSELNHYLEKAVL